MLEVYRSAKLASLALKPDANGHIGFVQLGGAPSTAEEAAS